MTRITEQGSGARYSLPDDRLKAMALDEIKQASDLLWEARLRYSELYARGRRVKSVYEETVTLTNRVEKLLKRLDPPPTPAPASGDQDAPG